MHPSPQIRVRPQDPRVFILLLAAFAMSHGQADTSQRMVEVHAEFVHATTVQMKGALEAAGLSEHPADALTPAQLEIVQRKLSDERATSFGKLRAVTIGGLHSAVDSVREVRFPTEYQPSDKTSGKSTATAFDSRDCGVMLDFEPVVDPTGSIIDLTYGPTVTDFLGFIDYASEKPVPAGSPTPRLEELLKAPLTQGGVWHPIFSTFKTIAQSKVGSGDTVFVQGPMKVEQIPSPPPGHAAPIPPDPGPNVVVFVTARVVPSK